MPQIGPIDRRDLIRNLRRLGFNGPMPGGRHEFMVRGERRVILPNPHRSDLSAGLLAPALRDGGVSRDEWERL
jgi:predicted RNA binding protein YcfA (HicA-like mRNA interferase family)